MRDRPIARAARPADISLDVVLCTPRGRQFGILLVPAPARARHEWVLPGTPYPAGEELDALADRAATAALGRSPAWLTQVGTFADGKRNPAHPHLTVGYVGVTPARTGNLPAGARWFSEAELPLLLPRQLALVDAALASLRERMDTAPVAFRLLAPVFTLGELQSTYELLLGRRLHKASFRRSLQAAFLVSPTDDWRSEGRGRPAQLFRFAPRRRRGGRRAVRFELLGG